MAVFRPCQGKTACRDDGTRCLTCGRTLAEIMRLRNLLEQLTAFAVEYGYENIDQYAGYLARKLERMIAFQHRQQETHGAAD